MKTYLCLASAIMIAATSTAAYGRDKVEDVFVSDKANAVTIRGKTPARETKSYRLRLPAKQAISLAVDGNNSACSLEISKTSQLGVLKTIMRFPAVFTDKGVEEDYMLSFYQNQASFMDGTICEYSFTIVPL